MADNVKVEIPMIYVDYLLKVVGQRPHDECRQVIDFLLAAKQGTMKGVNGHADQTESD